MIHAALIGAGRWGPNLLRNFCSIDDVEVKTVCDTDSERLKIIQKKYPDVKCTSDPSDIFRDSAIDCTVISTPLLTHFHLAHEALKAKQHVFVEKPLASSSEECRRLINLAETNKRVLLVGHTFKYNAGIRAAKQYIQSGELGRIYLIDANRTNFGPVRYDTNALWDLASHDVSIFSYWLNDMPGSVSARGGCYLNDNIQDVVYATFEYPNGVIAHVHASWLNPRKIREITVVGEQKMLIWNDMNLSEPIRIYNKSFEKQDDYYDTFTSFRLSIREGDVVIPNIQLNEPLMEECVHFIQCVRDNTIPLTDGHDGLQVVRSLEAAMESIESESRSVPIAYV